MSIVPVIAALSLLALPALADSTRLSSTQTSPSRTGAAQADQTDRANARYWGITVDEYRRYRSLMKGVRGSFSDPRITPLEVLGIHAESDAEQRRYAERFAQLMAEDAGRILRFEKAYQQAFRRLFPSLPAMARPARQRARAGTPASPGAFAAATQSTAGAMSQAATVTRGDRLLLFTSASCTACEAAVRKSLALIDAGIAVDLYLVGAQAADEVQQYGRRLALDPGLVERGQLTLNIDGGTLARVLPGQSALPQVVRKRGDALAQLAVAEL